jgi:hypothetical protein
MAPRIPRGVTPVYGAPRRKNATNQAAVLRLFTKKETGSEP